MTELTSTTAVDLPVHDDDTLILLRKNADALHVIPVANLRAALTTVASKVSLCFVFAGKPAVAALPLVTLDYDVTVPVGLLGTRVAADTPPAAAAVFTLAVLLQGGTAYTPVGTVTLQAGSHSAAVLQAVAAVVIPAGSVVRIAPSATQDTALANVCITVAVTRG